MHSRSLAARILLVCFPSGCTDGESPSRPARDGATDGASAGHVGTGGTLGTGGRSANGGVSTGGTSGSGGALGSGGAGGGAGGCTCPATPPVGGGTCPQECQGRLCVYEECDGRGLIQAACGGDWFLVTAACGDNPCGMPALSTCHPGQVCVAQEGGAIIYECRAHSCGKGPITCDCLADACPGCAETGPLEFSCNACPSGTCP